MERIVLWYADIGVPLQFIELMVVIEGLIGLDRVREGSEGGFAHHFVLVFGRWLGTFQQK